jgi:hypothetical protein
MDQSIAQPEIPGTNRPMKANNLSLEVKLWGKRWDVIQLAEISSPHNHHFHGDTLSGTHGIRDEHERIPDDS